MLKGAGANPSAVLAGVPSSDSSGTPGNATINARSGRCAIAAAAASVVITNNTVTAASHVFVTLLGSAPAGAADATLTQILRIYIPAGGGSFTIFGNAAATGNPIVDFVVIS